MGQKGGSGQPQTVTSSSSPPPQVLAQYEGLVNRATQQANQPYQQYPGELVAPLSYQTQAGLGGINQYAGAAQPYLGTAGGMTLGAASPVGMPNYTGGMITPGQAPGAVQPTPFSYGGQGGYGGGPGGFYGGGGSSGGGGASGGWGMPPQGSQWNPNPANPMTNQYGTMGGAPPGAPGAPTAPWGAPAGNVPSSVGQFMSPYNQAVVQATQNQFNNANQQAAQYLQSQNIGAGAFGGDRAGISQAVLANQQQQAQAPVIASLENQNYAQALNEFNTQQQTGLGAQQFNAQQQLAQQQLGMQAAAANMGQWNTLAQMGLGAQEFNRQQLGAMGQQYGNIGTAAQNAGLQGSMAQTQAGMIPQQEQQAIDQATQNAWQQQQAYPFQTTGWLGNLIEGTGSLSGGTSATSSPGPSPMSQGLGAATAGLGILGSFLPGGQLGQALGYSDPRLKEDIEPVGKTFDDQTIYRYRFKGDPRHQIGLMADETEHSHPEATARGLGGLRMIDLHAATEEAAQRGHFQGGGAPVAGAMGMPGGVPMGQAPITRNNLPPGQTSNPALALASEGVGPMQGARFANIAPGGAGATGLVGGPRPGFWFGGRPGFQVGGMPYVSYMSPDQKTVMTDAPFSPVSGVASTLWGAQSAAQGKPVDALDISQIQQIGTPTPDISTPYHMQAGSPQNYPAMDWQNPGKNFQTAGAEKSLAGLIDRPGFETQPTQSAPPQPAPSAPAAAPSGPDQWAFNNAMLNSMGQNLQPQGFGGPSQGFRGSAGEGSIAGPALNNIVDMRAMNNQMAGLPSGYSGAFGEHPSSSQLAMLAAGPPKAWRGGRQGFQAGGMPYGYYTPTTGNARAATWVPPLQAPPALVAHSPSAVAVAQHLANLQRMARMRAQAGAYPAPRAPYPSRIGPAMGPPLPPLHDRPPVTGDQRIDWPAAMQAPPLVSAASRLPQGGPPRVRPIPPDEATPETPRLSDQRFNLPDESAPPPGEAPRLAPPAPRLAGPQPAPEAPTAAPGETIPMPDERAPRPRITPRITQPGEATVRQPPPPPEEAAPAPKPRITQRGVAEPVPEEPPPEAPRTPKPVIRQPATMEPTPTAEEPPPAPIDMPPKQAPAEPAPAPAAETPAPGTAPAAEPQLPPTEFQPEASGWGSTFGNAVTGVASRFLPKLAGRVPILPMFIPSDQLAAPSRDEISPLMAGARPEYPHTPTPTPTGSIQLGTPGGHIPITDNTNPLQTQDTGYAGGLAFGGRTRSHFAAGGRDDGYDVEGMFRDLPDDFFDQPMGGDQGPPPPPPASTDTAETAGLENMTPQDWRNLGVTRSPSVAHTGYLRQRIDPGYLPADGAGWNQPQAMGPGSQGPDVGGDGRFITTSMMGGPPITALNLAGLFGGRGAPSGPVPPTPTALAPEHPAVAVARHIARQRAAARAPIQHHMSQVDPNMGPWSQDMAARRAHMGPFPPTNIYDPLSGAQMGQVENRPPAAWTGGRIGYQDGGAPTLDDPRYSYYTPTTGNVRGPATYHPDAPAVDPRTTALAPASQSYDPAPAPMRARAAPPVQGPIMDPEIIARQKENIPAPGPEDPSQTDWYNKMAASGTLAPAIGLPHLADPGQGLRPPDLPGSPRNPQIVRSTRSNVPGQPSRGLPGGMPYAQNPRSWHFDAQGNVVQGQPSTDLQLDQPMPASSYSGGSFPLFSRGGIVGYQGGGGVMGSSPLGNTMEQTPQGQGITGMGPGGRGLSAPSMAMQNSGFGALFGGGMRPGFQMGGFSDPAALAVIQGGGQGPFNPFGEAAVPRGAIGHGPPQAPSAAKPAAGGDLGSAGGDFSKALSGLAKDIKPPQSTVQQTSTSSTGDGGLSFDPDAQRALGTPDFSMLPDDTFNMAFGGRTRRHFADGGGDDMFAQDAPAPQRPPAPSGQGGIGSDAVAGNRFMGALAQAESGGRNIPQQIHDVNTERGTPAQGYYQIIDPTWQRYAAQAGVDTRQYPSAITAPKSVQDAVVSQIPIGQFGTRGKLEQQFGALDPRLTVGQLASRYGGADMPASGAQPVSATTGGGGYGMDPRLMSNINRAIEMQINNMGQPAVQSRPDIFGGLTAAGFGMMAGTSPNAMTNIGAGALEGMKYMRESRELDRQWALTEAQVRNLNSEQLTRGVDLAMKIPALNAEMAAYSKMGNLATAGGGMTAAPTGGGNFVIPGTSTAVPAPTAGGPTVTAGGPSGKGAAPNIAAPGSQPTAAGAPSGGDPYANIIPADNPNAIRQDINTLTPAAMFNPAVQKKVEQLQTHLKDVMSGAVPVQYTDGRAPGVLPGAMSKTEEETRIKGQQPAYEEFNKSAVDFEKSYTPQRAQLVRLAGVYQKFQSGKGTEAIAALDSYAKTAHIEGLLPPGWQNTAAGRDTAMKTAIDEAFKTVRENASRAPRTALQEALQTAPSPDNTPAANYNIIAQTIANLDYSHAMYQDVIGSGEINVAGRMSKFEADPEHAFAKYRSQADKEIPMAKGVTLNDYRTVMPNAKLERNSETGQVRDPQTGHVWDAGGNAVK